ncbi:hypothetical protein ACFLU1_04675 [Chloroflexota bacterium]
MPDYYFDIETYTKTPEPDLRNDMILTIQYQRIDSRTGEEKGELTILKAWESSEKEILQAFHSIFKPDKQDKWMFIPIGYNLSFEFFSLLYRWREIGIEVPPRNLFFEKPYIDLYSVGVMINAGSFKGATLGKLIGKQHSGLKVSEWYEQKDYASIEKYIKEEADGFISLYQCLMDRFPGLWREYAEEKRIII